MEEGGFLVHDPVLPETVTCGDTEDEALAMAHKQWNWCLRAGASVVRSFRKKPPSRTVDAFVALL